MVGAICSIECAALAGLRVRYADSFNGSSQTMLSFFAQQDHLRVFHYVTDCLKVMTLYSLPHIGTFDQPCRLATSCESFSLTVRTAYVCIHLAAGPWVSLNITAQVYNEQHAS